MAPFQIDAGDKQPQVNRARVMETLVIAALSGVLSALASGFVVTVRLEERIAHMQQEMNRQGDSIEAIRRVIYRPSWERPDNTAAVTAAAQPRGIQP
jgi:hypothetical protein